MNNTSLPDCNTVTVHVKFIAKGVQVGHDSPRVDDPRQARLVEGADGREERRASVARTGRARRARARYAGFTR